MNIRLKNRKIKLDKAIIRLESKIKLDKAIIRLNKAITRLDKAIIRLKNQDSLSENLLDPVVKGRNAGHLSGPIVSASERIGILSPEASHHLPEIVYRQRKCYLISQIPHLRPRQIYGRIMLVENMDIPQCIQYAPAFRTHKH